MHNFKKHHFFPVSYIFRYTMYVAVMSRHKMDKSFKNVSTPKCNNGMATHVKNNGIVMTNERQDIQNKGEEEGMSFKKGWQSLGREIGLEETGKRQMKGWRD